MGCKNSISKMVLYDVILAHMTYESPFGYGWNTLGDDPIWKCNVYINFKHHV